MVAEPVGPSTARFCHEEGCGWHRCHATPAKLGRRFLSDVGSLRSWPPPRRRSPVASCRIGGEGPQAHGSRLDAGMGSGDIGYKGKVRQPSSASSPHRHFGGGLAPTPMIGACIGVIISDLLRARGKTQGGRHRCLQRGVSLRVRRLDCHACMWFCCLPMAGPRSVCCARWGARLGGSIRAGTLGLSACFSRSILCLARTARGHSNRITGKAEAGAFWCSQGPRPYSTFVWRRPSAPDFRAPSTRRAHCRAT